MAAIARFGREPTPPAVPVGPRPGTVAAGAVAVVLLVAAGSVALFGGDQPGPAASPPPPAAVTAPGRAAAEAGEGDAGPESTVPLLTAPAVSWQLFAGVALPYSASAGPAVVDGPVYRSFARSQTGALVAAAHLSARMLLTPGQGWREVLDRQVLPGEGREVFRRLRAQVDGVDDPPGTYGQFAGFRIVAWTADVAVVQLATRFAFSGQLQTLTATVKWAGGDWRLELQPDGGVSPTAQLVPDLDGFVVWGGA